MNTSNKGYVLYGLPVVVNSRMRASVARYYSEFPIV